MKRQQDPRTGAAVVAVVCAMLAAAIWAGWLGWDDTYYRLPAQFPGDSGLHGPWTTAQVVGYALTVMVAAVIAAARWNPVATGLGMFAGTWVPFTIWALAHDDDGLAIIGIILSAIGMGVGAVVCAVIGDAIARAQRARHQRTT